MFSHFLTKVRLQSKITEMRLSLFYQTLHLKKTAFQIMSNLNAKFNTSIGRYCKYVPVNNFVYATNISLKNNYFYVETPKVACSSIKLTLIKMELEDIHLHYNDFEDIHNRNFSPLLNPKQIGNFDSFMNTSVFKFCFVRNPYTRLLSAYLDKIAGNKLQKRNILKHLGVDCFDLKQEITFEKFVEVICEQPITNMDSHWRVQYHQTLQDSIEYDYIGKFENLSDDLGYVLSKIRNDFQKFITAEQRHSSNANAKLQEYYTPLLIKKVQEKYYKDFEYFDYSTDIKQSL